MRFLIFICIGISSVLSWQGSFPLKPCLTNSTCSCDNVDGYYDLHPLANQNNTPRFRELPGNKGQYSYSYNPCYGFTEGNSSYACLNAAICQKVMKSEEYFVVGFADSITSVSSSEYGIMFRYTAHTDTTRIGYVILTCDSTPEGTLEFVKEDPPRVYYFKLYSKYACPLKGTPSPRTPPTHETPPPMTDHHKHHHTHPHPHPHPPTPPPKTKIFSITSVVILLLCILIVLTVLCGLIIVAICYFSAKHGATGKQPENAEVGHSVNNDIYKNDQKQYLKNDF